MRLQTSLHIVRVKQFVGLVGIGLAEEFLVNLLDERIFVGLPVLELVRVGVVQNGGAELLEIELGQAMISMKCTS